MQNIDPSVPNTGAAHPPAAMIIFFAVYFVRSAHVTVYLSFDLLMSVTYFSVRMTAPLLTTAFFRTSLMLLACSPYG